MRHSTGDVITLEEVLADRQYEPPAALGRLFESNGARLRVADLGANVGMFSAWLLARQASVEVVAFEPDPANAAVLEECVRANGRDGQWTVIRACAATQDGELPFVAGELAASHVAGADESGPVTRLPAVDVFPYLENVDFVKIDIEGGEWAILADERMRTLPARGLVVEYHPHLCPASDPRECAETLLTRAGWKVTHVNFDMPPGHGVLWARR